MGKFRSKLKGQTKGKRWPKGQSSSSNPETRKYRDLAKSRFFQENLGPSNLTSDALKKHDALSNFVPPKIPTASEMDTETESEISTYKTMQTFASDWSECSNVSFSRLMHVFKPDSAMHKKMLAVLAAVTEVIKQNGGTETSTEYYAALMTTLEVTETEMSLAAVLGLLNMGVKSVPHNVLRVQFPVASKLFIDLLNKNCDTENTHILKSLLGLLTALLRAQELAIWSSLSTLQIFGSILAFTCHTKPKVRKAAHGGVCAVLKASCFMLDDGAPTHHPAAGHVANFCVQQIEASTGSTSGQTTTLHTLTLLKDIIHTFPKKEMKQTCECILKIMTLNNALVNANGMQVLHSLFTAQKAVMPAQLNGQLVTALYEYQPAVGDVQATLAWLATLTAALVHLSDVDPSLGGEALPKAFLIITQLWLTERAQVMSQVTHSLQNLLEDMVAPQGGSAPVEKLYAILRNCLSYQYNKAWHLVLHVLSVAFKCAPKPELVAPLLQHLAELRDSYRFSYNNELEFAVGSAVKHLGPKLVLDVITLKKANGEINLERSWLLPVLKENVQYSTLEYFAKNILPLSIQCEKTSKLLSQSNDGIGAHSYELLYIQLWSLLTSFCKFPTDIKENFKNIAKVLGTAVSDRKELRLFVMSSLRKLIQNAKENDNTGEKNELGRFAKNYLPILFNLYTTKPQGTDEEGQRLAALDTIKEYLTISPVELTEQLFKNALVTLKSKSDETFTKESILDIVRCLAVYQKSELLSELYSECIKNFLDMKNKKEQKKAYRLLEEILNSESDGCKTFVKSNRKQIQTLITKTLNSAAVSSRSSRLRCQNYLIKAQPNLHHDAKLFKAVIPEAILCCKDINEKCRAAAQNVLISIGEILEKHSEMKEFTAMMLAGLAGTPEMVQATVLALAIIMHNFTSALGQENIKLLLETVTQLMSSQNREIVASCLVYLKIYTSSVPAPVVAQNLAEIAQELHYKHLELPVRQFKIPPRKGKAMSASDGSIAGIEKLICGVKSLTSMTEDCQKHFRLRVRDILNKLMRKFGCDSISAHIPPNDVIMYKRLRNLRKLQERKKRQKESLKNDEDSDEEFAVKAKPRSMEEILADSDSDLEEIEERRPETKKKISKTWLQEDEDDYLDFTDPSAVRKITSTRPGTNPVQEIVKKKNHGFKTSSDGRLIINDDSSDEDRTPKLNLNSDSDSEDDLKSAETAIIQSSKKRKRLETDSVASAPITKYRPGGSGIHRAVGPSRTPGDEYTSRKAPGDVRRKGQVDPYAYLPLSRQLLNKRKRQKSAAQFKGVVRAANKGARKGRKLKAGRVEKNK